MDRTIGDASTNESETAVDYESQLRNVSSRVEAGRIILQALVQKLARAVSMPEADIDVDKPAYACGVDSLVAVEIRYWFMKEMKADVAVFNIVGGQSVANLSTLAAGRSEYLSVTNK